MDLTLDGRLHEITRQGSIKNIYQALVELITNSDDAYRASGIEARDIWVEVVRHENEFVDVQVIDQASGMSKEQVEKSLLVYGSYTATDSSRGLFGRGAKDCSFLGDITFTCFQNGVLNQLIIYQNRKADFLMENVEVTQEHRDTYHVFGNGTHANLRCHEDKVVKNNLSIVSSLTNNIYLRKIYETASVVFRERSTNFSRKLEYVYPERNRVIKCKYNVEGYDTVAFLEIYRSKEPLPFPKTPEEQQYGIMVQSSKSIFEISALHYSDGTPVQDYSFNPNIYYITGTLTCDCIEDLTKQALEGNISWPKNPYSPIDSNRRNGLKGDHPFTIALFQHAQRLLSVIVERVQDTNDETQLDNGNTADVMNSLSDFLSDFVGPESVLYTFRTHDDHEKLAKLTHTLEDVDLDSEFLGLTWDQIQDLVNERFIQIESHTVQHNGIKLSFTTDRTVTTPYVIHYLPGNINLKINAYDSTLEGYIKIENDSVNFVHSGKAMTAIESMVIDAATAMSTRQDIIHNKTNNLNIDAFNEYTYINQNKRRFTAPGISARVHNSIRQFKDNAATSQALLS